MLSLHGVLGCSPSIHGAAGGGWVLSKRERGQKGNYSWSRKEIDPAVSTQEMQGLDIEVF